MAKILIVEDDATIVTYLSELLQSKEHVAVAANSVARALEVLEAERDFSLVILDHHLGEESGLKLLADIRNSERHRDLPVIVCSGDTKPASVKSFLALGIVGFIMKPFLAHRFVAEIELALLRGEGRTRPHSAAI